MLIGVTHHDRGRAVTQIDGDEDCLIRLTGAQTLLDGTVMGRLTTSAASYLGVITGTGTRATTMTARPGRSMQVGAYTALAGTLTSGAGPVTLTAPDGRTETVTITASGAQQFPLLGVVLTIAASGTAFVTGDSVVFTVAAATSRVYVPTSATGSNGAQDARAVLAHELSGESEDISAKVVTKGIAIRERLVIHGVSGVVSDDVADQLRAYGIHNRETLQLGVTEGTAS